MREIGLVGGEKWLVVCFALPLLVFPSFLFLSGFASALTVQAEAVM